MTSARRPLEPGLDDLLKALRAAGLPVGAREVMRLHRAFRLGPRLEQKRASIDQLRRLLAAALVHSPDEQALFDPIFRIWRARWQRWEQIRALERAPRPDPVSLGDLDTPPEPRRRPPIRWRRIAAAVAVVALSGGGAIYWHWPTTPELIDSRGRDQTGDRGPTQNLPIEDFKLVSREGQAAAVDKAGAVKLDPMVEFRGMIGSWLLLAAGAFIWLYRQQLRAPEALQPPSLPGPRRVPYLPLAKRGDDLLDPVAARAMVWGVDRHQTEQLTSEIDLDRTVDETARAGGIPELHFVPESRLREVWLWVDNQIEDPAFEQYAREIAESLTTAGLPVRLAFFDGVPFELVWDEGQRFRPEQLEGHRQSALVAILTDGDGLQSQLADTRAAAVRLLFGSLATWQWLSFVDCSGRGGLARLLPPGLKCVEPDALPHVFGLGEPSPEAHRTSDPSALCIWQAALALAPRRPTRAEAYALGRQLGLEVSPWHVPDVPGDTAESQRWFRAAMGPGLPDGSDLDHTLRFWEERLAEEERQREQRGSLEAWHDRPAHRFLKMEQALLKLWRRSSAQDAVAELTQLAASDQRLDAEISRRLGEHSADGVESEHRVQLPWRLEDLEGQTRERLKALGFSVGRGELTTPSRIGLAIAILAGLGAALLGQALRAKNADPITLPADCQREIWEHQPTDMRFVRVCAGRFRMGSEGDPDARGDEMPAHTVQLGSFWIGETEVSNEQYRTWRPDYEPGKGEDLPAVNVSWIDARAYCQWLGASEPTGIYDLPSEAQWEYAARGSDGRRYPWGNDEPTADLAVFGRGVDSSPDPVDQRPSSASPFGTLDQAGNVWEWARDCYNRDLYEERSDAVTINPVVMEEARCDTWEDVIGDQGVPEGFDKTSVFRVLRGGSFRVVPVYLRSADRDGYRPGFQSRLVGFRCVRGAHPPT